MNLYIGIDPGLNGGMTVINEHEEIQFKSIMPTIMDSKKDYDMTGICNIFKDMMSSAYERKGRLFVVLEKQYVRPVSGKRSCWMNGYGYGLLRMAISSLGLQTELVTPQMWMKSLGLNSKDEKGSIKYCLDKYPKEIWTATERSKIPHDGLTDSCVISIYGKRLLTGKNESNNNDVIITPTANNGTW